MECYYQLYVNKLNSPDERDKFLERDTLNVTEEEDENLNRL